jgi:chromosomal replication initiator protein
VQDTVAIWQAVLGEIELSISRGSFVTWFKNTHLIRLDGGLAVIGVPNIFIKQQLEKKYSEVINETLNKNGADVKKIDFKISTGPLAHKRIDDDPVILESAASAKSNSGRQSSLTHSYRQGLNEKYNFENFVVGSGNELAYAAAQAVAQTPGAKYNPLFLYGGVGIGKTHLMQAIGNQLLKNNPSAHIVYVSTEQFVQEFLDAIRYKKNTDFAGYYRSADMLIIDDIQFIAGKEKTQEEFFHTFNALHQANKQIVISSDKPPRDIPTLEDRLRSRFAWGMTIDMQNPDFETRCAIIQTKADQNSISLPADLVEYLANLVQTNIRELEGALNQLLAFCEMRGLSPDLAVATMVLGNSKNRPKHLSAKNIIEKTARHFSVSFQEITGPKRDKDIVIPRQIAMYMLRSELHLSFPKIAHELGRKDHTTAIHSVEKIESEMTLDPRVRQHIIEIKEKLYA